MTLRYWGGADYFHASISWQRSETLLAKLLTSLDADNNV